MNARHVLIVGGASGIGLQAARYFVAQGAAATVIDVDDTKLRQVEHTLVSAGGRALGLAADVRHRGSVDRAVASRVTRHGAIDTLIYTAGVLLPATLADMTEAAYDLTFDVNTKGFWHCVQAGVAHFAPGGGAIVAVSSSSGQRPKAGNGAYAASKVAMQFLARTLALELAGRQIRVNCVCPSMLTTPLTEKLRAQVSPGGFQPTATTPLGRVCTEHDVVQAIAFLCSPHAAFITGTTLPVDGGATAGVPLRP